MIRHLYICILLSGLINGLHSSYTAAQEGHLKAELFNTLDGLTQSHVSVVYQDSIGFLWIGTQDGLNKYDGYTFQHYRNQPLNSSSISDNYIRAIDEDSDGNLWIGTNGGLNRLDRKTGTFMVFPPLSPDNSGVADTAVYGIFVDSNDQVWFKTYACLEVLDHDSGNIKVYSHFYDQFSQIPSTPVYQILDDRKGNIWFGTKDGLQQFNRMTKDIKRFYHDPSDPNSISNNRVRAIYRDSHGNLWIGTEEGLNLFNQDKLTFSRIPLRNTINSRARRVNTISEDSDGILWIGTDMGFFKMTTHGDIIEYITSIEANNKEVQLSSVYSIIEDQSKIIWLGTYEGLVKVDRKKRKFNILDNSEDSYPGLSGNNISAIYEDNQGKLWIGTWGFGLNVIDRQKKNVTLYSRSQENYMQRISNDYIFSIYNDSKNRLWAGTSNGVNFLDKQSGRFRLFCENSKNISCYVFRDNNVYDILEDRAGNIWFAAGDGLHRYLDKYDEIRSYYMIFSGSENFDIRSAYCLLQDTEGMIWIGTENGLVRYNPGEDIFNVFRKENTGPQGGLSNNTIYSLYLDSKSVLWIGTASGLNSYDREKEYFRSFPELEDLLTDQIYAILEDQDTCLWLSTNRGLYRFNPARKDYLAFNLSDGLQNYEFNLGSAFMGRNGELFFGGISGLNYFHPDSILFNEHIPGISFTNFEIAGELGRTVLPLERTLSVEVMQGNRIFTIGFAALDFTAPENNRYIYKMVKQGSEGSWIQIGRQHYVTFYNLSPGSYIFSVKGSNNDNIWNPNHTSLRVNVPPPIWSSWQAYLFYSILLVIIIYLIIQFRTRSLRRSNKILKEKEIAAKVVEKQKEELMLKNKNITDSINYAKRIQFALLPSSEIFKKILPDSFILYKPKDIVSGDFYWINENRDKIFVAAVDCTGHGVPGAFVSILGFELFRKITSGEEVKSPAEILGSLNENFAQIFSDGEQVYLKDGMDLSLCVLYRKEKYLEFSGAFNPLYLIRDETIIEIKANRFSVGADFISSREDRTFRSHKILLQKGDILYMFSDGYADQFGGPEGKKFKYRRFRHLLLTIHKIPLEKQKAILEASIEEWRGDYDQIDDIMVIGIRPDFWNSRLLT